MRAKTAKVMGVEMSFNTGPRSWKVCRTMDAMAIKKKVCASTCEEARKLVV